MANKLFDILILGGGPAGASAALALTNSGLRVALADKSHFPRHKTCGDAIPGPTLKMLKKILPDFSNELAAFTARQEIKHCEIIAPGGRAICFDWKAEAYNSPRIDFDNFLFGLVKKYTGTTIYESFEAGNIRHTGNGWEISGKNTELILTARLLIAADGANSTAARQVRGEKPLQDGHCTAVSAYYRGILSAQHTNKFFLLKNYLPGYFWVFPVGNQVFNVGFGIMTNEISRRGLKLKEILDTITVTDPLIKNLFAGSEKISETKGFGLPLGGKEISISGDSYMLTGDAASLIDPLQGHGIDKAVYSGIAAARQTTICFENDDFGKDCMRGYDRIVYARYSSEFRRNYRLMKLLHKQPWMVNAAARVAGTGIAKKIIAKWF